MKTVFATSADHRDDVTFIFDATAAIYYEFWGEFFHLAVFEEPIPSQPDFDEAFERTHQWYFDVIGGRSARRILEVATGGGALAEWMARRTTAEVLGVDLSETQLTHARRRLSDDLPNLRFVRHDAMTLASLDEPLFDAAICLDAACYFPDKQLALEQIAAKLEPGARFLLVDWCMADKVPPLQSELIVEPFNRAWGIPYMATIAGYEQAFDEAGFDLLGARDLSEHVAPNWERGYRAALSALPAARAVRLIGAIASLTRYGRRALDFAKQQFYAAILARVAADAGLLRYAWFLAERRARS